MLEFKPLKQKRGSILLIVVSMMSVLIMLAQALLLSVSVTQQTQVTNFYDKQAYQTSLSVTDIVAATLMSGNSNSQAILNKLTNPGDTLSTGPNGFSALGEINGAEQFNKVGAYRVDITRKDDTKNGSGDTLEVYEIAVLTDFNGMKETVTSTIYVKVTKDKFVGFDRMFTATGYATGDVFINNSILFNPAYFDNEYTVVNATDNSTTVTYSNVICGGTMQIETSQLFSDKAKQPRDLVVRNDLIVSSLGNNSVNMYLHGGQIFVAGDLRISSKGGSTIVGKSQNVSGTEIKRDTSIFILGDVIVDSSLKIQNLENMYIGGDLRAKSMEIVNNNTNIYVNGNIQADISGNGNVFYNSNKSALKFSGESECTFNNLKEVSASDVWSESGKKEIVKSEDNKLIYHKSNDGSIYTISKQNIWDLINNLTEERVYPKFSPSDEFKNVTAIGGNAGIVFDKDNYTCYIEAGSNGFTEGAIIENVTVKEAYQGTDSNIAAKDIVPTYIIENNQTETKDGKTVPKPFTVLLKENNDGQFSWTGDSGKPANVIILGSSPVFIEIEDGTKYVAKPYDFVGHYGWYTIIQDSGGSLNDHKIFKINESDKATWVSSKITNRSEPKNDGDSVVQYLKGLINSKEDEDKDETGQTIAYAVNAGKLKPELQQDLENMNVHNNLYLVSDDEYASIDMNADNCFFAGFVYAPYMTYRTIGGGGAGMAIAGGLIVSDYVLDHTRGYMFFKPSIDITELFDEYLMPITKREWKKASYG